MTDNHLNFVSATDLLPSFGLLKERVIYLSSFYDFDFYNKKINELNDIELIWIEAIYYILFGVAGAEYLMFLKGGEFKNVLNDIEQERNNNELRMVNNIFQIELINIKSKILVLRELGIIDLLNKKFNSNNIKVAACIGVIINEKSTSIRGILSNINAIKNNNTNPENITSLNNAIIVLNDLAVLTKLLFYKID